MSRMVVEVDISGLKEMALPEEAAEFLRLKTADTLRNWRSQGKGPRYVKNGHRILYPREELGLWLAKRLSNHEP